MKLPDPLLKPNAEADRLHYATGELLGADDFRDEQTYHRRQLARALLFLHGSGTIAGLRVVARHLPGPGPSLPDVQLDVEPGLALDRAGRLIEVPRPACLRLRRWYEFIENQPPDSDGLDADDLRAAFHAGEGVVADIFLTFHPCNRGYTPAFASGPFDALDASQPSRVRDAYELSLVLRPQPDPLPVAFDPWAAIGAAPPADRPRAAQKASLDAWTTLALPPPDTLPDAQNPPGADPTAVLLARLSIPAGPAPDADSAPEPDWSAGTWADTSPGENPNIDNSVRYFLLPPAALRHLLSP